MSNPVRPDSPETLAEIVRESRAAGHAVTPLGGGTQTHLGYPLSREAVAIDCRGLNRIRDYPARDLTVTVEAGLTFAELANQLHHENQRLPIDVPDPARATVGGTLAANVAGPRRLGFGTLRDYLIGLTVTTDAGELAHAGGRVVKNVAGYDLMKLHTGALGTLGIITQATFKVSPVPETRRLVVVGLKTVDVAATLDRLHNSAARPVIAELWNAAFARTVGTVPATDWVLVCGFEEKAKTVAWQVETVLAELHPHSGEAWGEAAADAVWTAFAALPKHVSPVFSLQIGVLPSRVAEVANHWHTRFPEAPIHAHALSGVIQVHWVEPSNVPGGAELAPLTPAAPGNLAVTRAPADWVGPRWHRSAGELALMRALKTSLDPTDLFNPGRLFG